MIYSGGNIYDLYHDFTEKSDGEAEKYKTYLLGEIKKKIRIKKIEDIDDLSYSEDRDKLQQILLLFNLDYLVTQEDSEKYFEFNRFQTEQWSLEHIYAQNSQSIREVIKDKKIDEIKKWLQEVRQYANEFDKPLGEEIERLLKNFDLDKKGGDGDIFERIDEAFKDNTDG